MGLWVLLLLALLGACSGAWGQTLDKSQMNAIAVISNIGSYGWQPGFPCASIAPRAITCDKNGFVISLKLPKTTGAFLPSQIGDLTRLTSLVASKARFSGALPASLGKLQLLQTLRLDGNLFEGPLPASLSQLQNLKVLNVSSNLITGVLPAGLQNAPSLSQVDISRNYISGRVAFKGAKCAAVRAGQNCLAKGSPCTTQAAQRPAEQCRSACNANVWQTAAAPVCGGNGVCVPNGPVTFGAVSFWSCACTKNYVTKPGAYDCKPKTVAA